MKRLTSVFVFLLVTSAAAVGQPIHKNARLYIESMPENIDSLIGFEIARQKIPLKVVGIRGDSDLVMRETSGFTGPQGEKEEVRLAVEIFDSEDRPFWPGSPGQRHFRVNRAAPGWQQKIARKVASRLGVSVQRYVSTASSTDGWWPWTRKESPERVRYSETGTVGDGETAAAAESTRPSALETSGAHPAWEVNLGKVPENQGGAHPAGQVNLVSVAPAKNSEIGVSFSPKPAKVKPGMTEAEVLTAIGHPPARQNLDGKTIYQYEDLVVEFLDGRVTDVKVP